MERWGLSPDELRDLMLTVKPISAKRPLTPVEAAELFNTMLRHGATRADCARICHLDGTTMVTRFVRLLELVPDVRHNVEFGSSSGAVIGFSTASELTRLPCEDQDAVRRAILEHRLTKAEVAELSQLRERSGKPIEACIEQVLKLRPTIIRRYMYVGAVTDSAMQEHLATLGKEGRDRLIQELLQEYCPTSSDKAGRLGVDRFSLVGDERLDACLRSLEGGFEHAFNASLAKKYKAHE